jgi:small subunit ribosomal protein S1
MMFYKDSEVRRRQEARVTRPLPTNSPDRIPLSQITPGSELKGVVISLVDFGAYVDVQSECDGLLHISQITRTDFISHPKVVFQPGDAVTVRVLRVSPELKKLQLTMLSALEIEKLQEEQEDDVDEERIQLEDLAVDDELWGEIKRVTSFGAFVELGAKVDGFLHFMDHPEFGQVPGAKPSSFMKVNDRIRCWVSDIDSEKSRIKLTANRPPSLPGPRREIKSM